MNVAVVSTMDEAPWGGSEELWARMAQVALRDGHRILSLTSSWPEIPNSLQQLRERGAKIKFQEFPSAIATKSSRRYLRMLQLIGGSDRGSVEELQRYREFYPLKKWNPHVVCVNLGWSYEFMFRPGLPEYLQTGSAPYVLLIQYVDDRYFPKASEEREAIRHVIEQAAQVVFVAERNRADVERHLATRLDHAVVVRNPINLSTTDIVSWPCGDEVAMASVARLSVRAKGQDLLFDTLAQPPWQERSWTLNIYGTGPDRNYLESLAAHFGLAEKIRFHGHIQDVRQIWADNHLLVLPSRGEGTPMSLVEAQVCGRPATVTDVGGNLEWVEEGTTGFVAAAASTSGVAAALERAWKERAKWREMGQRAHTAAMAKIDGDPGKTLLSLVLAAAGRKHESKSAQP